jgi:hypothetical protein
VALEIFSRPNHLTHNIAMFNDGVSIRTRLGLVIVASCLFVAVYAWVPIVSLKERPPSGEKRARIKGALSTDSSTAATPLPSPTNLFFVRPAKTGSTTLRNVLERYARSNDLVVFDSGLGKGRGALLMPATCESSSSARKRWVSVLSAPNRKLNVVAEHCCLSSWMRKSQVWQGRPVVLTLLRHPWERWISQYRFTRERCADAEQRRGATASTSDECKTHASFQSYLSAKRSHLNYYHMILGGPNRDNKMSDFNQKALLNKVDFALVTEMFDESLVALALQIKLDPVYLPYVVANRDKSVAAVDVNEEFKREVLRKWLKMDVAIYDEAKRRLNVVVKNHGETFQNLLRWLKATNEMVERECKRNVKGVKEWYDVNACSAKEARLECEKCTARIAERERRRIDWPA